MRTDHNPNRPDHPEDRGVVPPAATRPLNGDDHATARSQPSGNVQLSDNARVIVEKRYLRKDEQGNPVETPEGLFRRVAGAMALAEDQERREAWESRFSTCWLR